MRSTRLFLALTLVAGCLSSAAVADGSTTAVRLRFDVVTLQPRIEDETIDATERTESTLAFCAHQQCDCSGAGCRCTSNTGTYCTNASDGQTCVSGPCGGGGGTCPVGTKRLQALTDEE